MAVLQGPLLPPLIPRRRCAVCALAFDVLHLRLLRGRWVCGPCLRGDERTDSEDADGAVAPDPGPSREEALAILRRVEMVTHWGGLFVRVGVYVVLAALAYRSPLWTQFLTGVLLADVISRIVAAFFELRRHRFGIALEVALYLVVGRVWVGAGGTLSLPDDLEAKAITMLGFLLVFAIRCGLVVYRVFHGEDD